MKILFVGASTFGYRCCHHLIESGFTISGILTNEESFKISYAKGKVKNVNFINFSDLADPNGIPFYRMKEKMNEAPLKAFIDKIGADLAVVVGWYHMIPRSFLAQMDYYGIHASLLPAYSGGAPLVWSIIKGEEEAGVTLFQFSDGVDNGPIVEQAALPIAFEDTIKTLYDRMEKTGMDLLSKGLSRMQEGDFNFVIQDESKRTIFPQRSPEDGVFTPEKTAREAYNFIRAQTRPYPGAFIEHPNGRLKIWSSTIHDDPPIRPVVETAPRIFQSEDGSEAFIQCADGKWIYSKDVTQEPDA